MYIICRNYDEFTTYTTGRSGDFVYLCADRWDTIKTAQLGLADGFYDLTYIGCVRMIQGAFDSPVYHDILNLRLQKKIYIELEWEPIV